MWLWCFVLATILFLVRWEGVIRAWILNKAVYEMRGEHLQDWVGIEKCLVTHFLQVPSRDSPGIYGEVIGCDEHTNRVFSSLANGTCSNVWMTFPSHLFIQPKGTLCMCVRKKLHSSSVYLDCGEDWSTYHIMRVSEA